MSNIKDGENEIPIAKDLVRNTAGLSIVSISPAQISLDSYRLMPLTVPIEVRTKGRLPSGVTLKSIKAEPPSLSVMVPSTLAESKVIIATESIDLRSISDTLSIAPKIVVPPDIRFTGEKLPEVKVIIEVEKKEKQNE
jgi:YbbR domain-containing protein